MQTEEEEIGEKGEPEKRGGLERRQRGDTEGHLGQQETARDTTRKEI